MFRMVYISRVARDFGEVELGRVLRVSRSRNRRDGITGMLIYSDILVLQILEGPEENVRACYNRIRLDPRHSSIDVIDERRVDDRAFSDWTMGLGDPRTLGALHGASLYSLVEIMDRLDAVSGTNVSKETLALVSTMRTFMARVQLRQRVKQSVPPGIKA